MCHYRWFGPEMERTNPFPCFAVARRATIVLAHVLAPSLDYVSLNVASGVCYVAEETPHDGAVAATDGLESPHRKFEFGRTCRFDSKFQINHHRTLFLCGSFPEVGNFLQHPRLWIEALRAAERKAHRRQQIHPQKEREPSPRKAAPFAPSCCTSRSLRPNRRQQETSQAKAGTPDGPPRPMRSRVRMPILRSSRASQSELISSASAIR